LPGCGKEFAPRPRKVFCSTDCRYIAAKQRAAANGADPEPEPVPPADQVERPMRQGAARPDASDTRLLALPALEWETEARP
jgi:hypothetical protein